MKLGYTIIYVPDVAASLDFFERAFGLKRRFLHESGTYGELETGETTLSFAAHELGDTNFPGGHVHALLDKAARCGGCIRDLRGREGPCHGYQLRCS